FELAQTKLDIRGADPCGVFARLFQHLMSHVDADYTAVLAHLSRGEKTVEAGTAAEIDHDLAGLQGCDRLRVAAAEPEIRAVRYRGEFGGRIAHLPRLVRRRTGCRVSATGAGRGTAARITCRFSNA